MSLSKKTAEILVVAMADKKAAQEIVAAIAALEAALAAQDAAAAALAARVAALEGA